MTEKEYDYESLTEQRWRFSSLQNRMYLEWKDMTEAEQIEKLKKELSEMQSRLSRLTIPKDRGGMTSTERGLLWICVIASALSAPISFMCWMLFLT